MEFTRLLFLTACAGASLGKRFGADDRLAMRLLGGTLLTTRAHRDALVAAGYSNVEVFEERRRGWICAVGTKSA